ncbi:hypothetical protein Q7W79_16450 [Vibrio parahaemolyticus]|nr:hypothetical protein Q7W79_16450 [Vibrio parahaemolyticus]
MIKVVCGGISIALLTP